MAVTIFEKPMGAEVETLKGQIGTLSSLTTAAKGSAVGAINELNSKIKINSMTSTNLNDYKGSIDYVEYYTANNIKTFTNIPGALVNSSFPFVLEVIKFQYYTKQILHIFNSSLTEHITYIRQQTYSGGAITWGNWDSYVLNSKIGNLACLDTVVNANNTFTLNVADTEMYFVTHMTSSNESGRSIILCRRVNDCQLIELGKGTWQAYYTESFTNGVWSFTPNYYTVMKIIKL